MSRAITKIHFPRTRLAELVARSGGMSREQAVEAANASAESLRELAFQTIEITIRDIEAGVACAKNNRLDAAGMKEILDHADRLVTMTSMFELDMLEEVLKSLCDVIAALTAQACEDAAPILVHVQAMRLLAPGGAELDIEPARHILSNLAKVRHRYCA